jgi:hypothetical protein
LERTQNQTIRPGTSSSACRGGHAQLFLKHAVVWTCLLLAAAIVFTAPWWWQKLAALPCASIVAVISLLTDQRADMRRPLLIPYIDPLRKSSRTGQTIYQFVCAPDQLRKPTGEFLMTTTLEQLIASFLQLGLAKLDTTLSPAIQQLIGTAVPTFVSTIASVVVDLAENHKAVKSTSTAK